MSRLHNFVRMPLLYPREALSKLFQTFKNQIKCIFTVYISDENHNHQFRPIFS